MAGAILEVPKVLKELPQFVKTQAIKDIAEGPETLKKLPQIYLFMAMKMYIDKQKIA